MACNCAGSQKAVPYIRPGLPTVWQWGPFVGYEVVEYVDDEH